MSVIQINPRRVQEILDLVYTQGDKKSILSDLRPRETANYFELDCPNPACKSRKAFIYKNSGKICCNRPKCGCEMNLVQYVAGTPQQPRGQAFKAAVIKLAWLAGLDLSMPVKRQALVSKPDSKPRGFVLQPELEKEVCQMNSAFQTSRVAKDYLLARGIPVSLASKFQVGYAPYGAWPHRSPKTGKLIRQWRPGRIAFPIRDAHDRIVNCYGRVAGDCPKHMRHDFLPGSKGIFNQKALGEESVIVFEGIFDALSMIAAGYSNSIAVSGLHGIPWHLARATDVCFGFDPETVKSDRWLKVLTSAQSAGKRVHYLSQETFAGFNDLNAVWAKTKEIKIVVKQYR